MHICSIIKHSLKLLLRHDNANIHLVVMVFRFPIPSLFLGTLISIKMNNIKSIYELNSMLIILIAIYFVINLFTHKKYLIIIICIITCILLRTDNFCFDKINKSDIYKVEEVKECIFVYQNLNIKDYSKKSYFYKGKFLQRNKSKKAFYKKILFYF